MFGILGRSCAVSAVVLLTVGLLIPQHNSTVISLSKAASLCAIACLLAQSRNSKEGSSPNSTMSAHQ